MTHCAEQAAVGHQGGRASRNSDFTRAALNNGAVKASAKTCGAGNGYSRARSAVNDLGVVGGRQRAGGARLSDDHARHKLADADLLGSAAFDNWQDFNAGKGRRNCG